MFLSKFHVVKIIKSNLYYFSEHSKQILNKQTLPKLKQLRPKTPEDEYEELFQKTMCKSCVSNNPLEQKNKKNCEVKKTSNFKKKCKENKREKVGNVKVCEKPIKKTMDVGQVTKKEIKMDALVFKPLKKEIFLEQVLLPDKLRKDEVSINVKYAVANQVDLTTMEVTNNETSMDVVPGRELSGIVCGVGDQVQHVKAGDNVVVCPCHPASLCRFCHEQKLTTCVKERCDGIFGITRNGAWAQFTAVPGNLVYKVDEISLDKAALLPLLGQVMCSLSKLNITSEKNVLIQGCGLAGCLFALLLKHNGHERVSIWEDNPNRTKIIQQLSLDYPIITPAQLEECKIDIVISNGSGADVMMKAIKAMNDYGQFFIFGQPGKNGSIPQIKVNSIDISRRSLTIMGSAGTTVNPSKISASLANKLINLCKLGVPTYPLKEFKKGLTELSIGDVNSVLLQICKENKK